ncbi:hypothetical protein ABT294_45415 [Nonomuraea sp. NPDC000554]|uniref:hypothetical protein n=1 Tax=Nonomuraea sp. NPDC000554 TaxID=3154259 RepID=UPI003328403D
MATRTFPFSTLINKQTSVFPALDDADVVLERRDAENLVLMRSERFQAMTDGLRLAARSLSIIARSNRGMAEEVFAEELPWLKWLPAEARPECVTELLDHLLAGAETGLLIPFARALREWMSTAEIYSDPELARRLRGPFDTTTAVDLPRPSTDE